MSAPTVPQIDRGCLSYWFPRLRASQVLCPETAVLETSLDLLALLCPERAQPDASGFFDALRQAAAIVSEKGPWFLRTGHGSGKHEWGATCFVTSLDDIPRHVLALVEWSEMVDMIGLPYRVWAVREYIEPRSAFCAFAGMPVAKERRYFIRDGNVECHHPYWPADAMVWRDGVGRPANWRLRLAALNREHPSEVSLLTHLSAAVAAQFEGGWSLDWMQAESGEWYAIDMAPAERSWHPEHRP